MQVIHQPRVAWDMARTIGGAFHDETLFGWLRGELDSLFGPAAGTALAESRDRVHRAGDARLPVETGLWRVRIEDALRQRPELGGELAGLASIARARRP
ncbi:hypothetical protein [Micromonospora robiginosa]|uniref:Uncharacterized protein n=1 Tax=Micromonospora robiginosa TaxID=2749844 RepID=A0AAF0P684_9ACTN|nr:hypothetical protein [Micromonospora ferruginea]WMF04581.1 hypothetical protein H1D33_30290 [Micromonospora ferruginea]